MKDIFHQAKTGCLRNGQAYACRKDNCIVVALIASRTNIRNWHDYVIKAKEVRLIKGILVFGQPGKVNVDPAPFPSAVVVFSNESETPIFSAMSSKPLST